MARTAAWHGEVVSIHIAPKAEDPMRSVQTVRAIAGKGLEGDRYFKASGTYSDRPGPAREITLIESEAIEAMARDNELVISPGEARRNVITRGVPLNHLVGREFVVGGVRLRGIRLCEPCSHLEGLTRRGVLAGLIHRGGLRAQILVGGEIRVGDPIAPPILPRPAQIFRLRARTHTERQWYSRSVNHSAVSGASLIAGPQSRAPNADAPDRDRAGGVRALEGAAAGRGVRARPRRMRWPLVHPDPSEGGVGPGQDFSDPEVDTEPDRAEAPGLVPREPRAARACPPPADTARIPLRLHD